MMKKKKFTKELLNTEKKIGHYSAIVMGASAGGLAALSIIVAQIDKDFRLPIIVVQHLYPESDDFIARKLDTCCKLKVLEADEKEKIKGGTIYIAPANYHLMIEENQTFSLTIDPKVNYSRPSIDVLFNCASEVYDYRLIGVLLTGANEDGARGLKKIKDLGGVTIVQEPTTAEVPAMPQSAINLFPVDYILPVDKIFPKIQHLTESNAQ